MLQDIVRNSYQGVLFTKRFTIFTKNSQAVHVRINSEAYVCPGASCERRELGKMVRQWLGVMGEIAVWGAVELENFFHTQSIKQFRDGGTSNGVHTINGDTEIGRTDGILIYQCKR